MKLGFYPFHLKMDSENILVYILIFLFLSGTIITCYLSNKLEKQKSMVDYMRYSYIAGFITIPVCIVMYIITDHLSNVAIFDQLISIFFFFGFLFSTIFLIVGYNKYREDILWEEYNKKYEYLFILSISLHLLCLLLTVSIVYIMFTEDNIIHKHNKRAIKDFIDADKEDAL